MALILVVDDEQAIVDLLIEVIEELGHTVMWAANGRRAFTITRERRPELIISDVMMPLMDGYALTQAIRADPTLAHTPIYLMSAAFSGTRNDLSVDGYIAKPFDIYTIEQILADLSALL